MGTPNLYHWTRLIVLDMPHGSPGFEKLFIHQGEEVLKTGPMSSGGDADVKQFTKERDPNVITP